jgi:hypothetical protein
MNKLAYIIKAHTKLKLSDTYKWSIFKLLYNLIIVGSYQMMIAPMKSHDIKIVLLGKLVNKSYIITHAYINSNTILKSTLLNIFLSEFELLRFKGYNEIIFPIPIYNKSFINFVEDILDFEVDINMKLINQLQSKEEGIIYFVKKL